MVKREKSNYMIQSVSHALDVLEELCKSRGEVGVTELSKRLKLHKNNVFRLLATLELRGYVEQNPDSEDYRLGVKSLELGQSYLIQSSIVERSKPILAELCENTGETVSFAVLHSGKEVQYPLSFESKRPVRCASRVAVSFGAKFNAAGRLLLAQLICAVCGSSNLIIQSEECTSCGLIADSVGASRGQCFRCLRHALFQRHHVRRTINILPFVSTNAGDSIGLQNCLNSFLPCLIIGNDRLQGTIHHPHRKGGMIACDMAYQLLLRGLAFCFECWFVFALLLQ